MGVIKGDTRSLDYGLYVDVVHRLSAFLSTYFQPPLHLTI